MPSGAEAAARSYLRALGIRGADVDELAQAAFAIAVRRRVEPTRRWLRETTRNLAANYRRLNRHKFEVLDPDAGETASVELAEPELRLDVRRALAKLEPEDAELLVRHLLGGEELPALGRELGLSRSGTHLRLALASSRFIELFERGPERRPSPAESDHVDASAARPCPGARSPGTFGQSAYQQTRLSV